MFPAGVAHLVERHLAKVEVASSSLVTRSINSDAIASEFFLLSEARLGFVTLRLQFVLPKNLRQPGFFDIMNQRICTIRLRRCFYELKH